MLAWRNTSPGASRAPSVSPSPFCKETISISALSGCPSWERTDNLPKPAAQASEGKMRLATAAKQVFEATFPTCHPKTLSGNKLKYHHGLSLASSTFVSETASSGYFATKFACFSHETPGRGRRSDLRGPAVEEA